MGAPPFSTQVAQTNFYFRPNLDFLLGAPPALQALSDFLSLFRHFNRRNFKRRVTNFLALRAKPNRQFLERFRGFCRKPAFS